MWLISRDDNYSQWGEYGMKLRPFGLRFLEYPFQLTLTNIEKWSWKPPLAIYTLVQQGVASIPSTTGTGPMANQDERQEEF